MKFKDHWRQNFKIPRFIDLMWYAAIGFSKSFLWSFVIRCLVTKCVTKNARVRMYKNLREILTCLEYIIGKNLSIMCLVLIFLAKGLTLATSVKNSGRDSTLTVWIIYLPFLIFKKKKNLPFLFVCYPVPSVKRIEKLKRKSTCM